MVLVLAVIEIPLPGIIAALAFSGATHAVIDWCWMMQRIITAKACTGWREAPFWVDLLCTNSAAGGAQ